MFSIVSLVVILGWSTFAILIFAARRTPASLSIVMISGLLLLPHFEIDLPFLDFTKPTFLALSTLALALCLDGRYRRPLEIGWLDLPVLMTCFAGFCSSISVGNGAYDGVVSLTELSITWFIPYLVGRLVFATNENAMTLLNAIVLGALLYIPFCVFEMRMSPALHYYVFGYGPRTSNDAVHAMRYGLWRPVVFMETGLQLALFMGTACVMAAYAAIHRWRMVVAAISAKAAAGLLAVTTVMCVSSGAILLMGAGWLIAVLSRIRYHRFPLTCMMLFALGYPVFRMTNVGAIVIETSDSNSAVEARKESLMTRVRSEDLYIDRWEQRPLFGWTRRFFWRVEGGGAVPDSLWIIMLACFGLFGWVAWSAFLALSGVLVVVRNQWATRQCPVAICFASVVLLFWMDSLLNAFPTIVFGVLVGSVVGLSRNSQLNSHESGKKSMIRSPRKRPTMTRQLWPRPSERVTASGSLKPCCH